jgi:hypothetical protein
METGHDLYIQCRNACRHDLFDLEPVHPAARIPHTIGAQPGRDTIKAFAVPAAHQIRGPPQPARSTPIGELDGCRAEDHIAQYLRLS